MRLIVTCRRSGRFIKLTSRCANGCRRNLQSYWGQLSNWRKRLSIVAEGETGAGSASLGGKGVQAFTGAICTAPNAG